MKEGVHPLDHINSAMSGLQSDTPCNFKTYTGRVVAAAWRGRFKIPGDNLKDIDITAHVFDTAILRQLNAASMKSQSLCLEVVPHRGVWPASYKSSPPTERNMGLIFFSSGRDGEILDSLLKYAITGDLALKTVIAGSELLIFTSVHLADKLHRFQGKPYFWGAFMGRESDSPYPSDHHLHNLTARATQMLSSDSRKISSAEMGGPVIFSRKHDHFIHAAKADRRSGRRLDAAWEHARPLDVLRQKAECKHCGFFSSHGGISRLKAHLGGGDPRIRLPGCPKVPPEIKRVMAEWFVNWVRATKALWTKEIREALADKRGFQHEVPWESCNQLDAADQKRDTKHIDFTFLQGYASLHHVNMPADPKMGVQAFPEASPETGPKFTGMKNSRSCASDGQKDNSQVERRGRPLDDAWNHAKPLDEARQKTQCRYCGFISPYGGISRLKAHLGGGSPHIQLQGCHQVPPHIKSAMEQWFNEWAKYSNAGWTKRYPGAGPKPCSKRGRPLEDVLEHGIPWNETKRFMAQESHMYKKESTVAAVASTGIFQGSGKTIKEEQWYANELPSSWIHTRS